MDYNDFSTSVSFPPGATPGINDQSCFFFSPINDILIEYTDNVLIMASPSSNNPGDTTVQFTQGGNMVFIDIIDDDGEFTIQRRDYDIKVPKTDLVEHPGRGY